MMSDTARLRSGLAGVSVSPGWIPPLWHNLPSSCFSDYRHEIEGQVAEDDLVVTRITGSGRHTGDFLGIPPTGKEVTMHGISIHRVENGKLAEHWDRSTRSDCFSSSAPCRPRPTPEMRSVASSSSGEEPEA